MHACYYCTAADKLSMNVKRWATSPTNLFYSNQNEQQKQQKEGAKFENPLLKTAE